MVRVAQARGVSLTQAVTNEGGAFDQAALLAGGPGGGAAGRALAHSRRWGLILRWGCFGAPLLRFSRINVRRRLRPMRRVNLFRLLGNDVERKSRLTTRPRARSQQRAVL